MERVRELDAVRLEEFLNSSGRKVERAMRRAARSATTRLKSLIVTDLRVRHKVRPSEFAKVRVRMKAGKKSVYASLWIGSNEIPIEYLRPSFSRKGVSAGGKLHVRAFMPWKSKGKAVIFARKGEDRLPIERVTEKIDELVLMSLEAHWPAVREFFMNEAEKFMEGGT